MKKINSIVIPNATSPRNLGDKAMLDGMIILLNKISKKIQIIVHSTDPQLYEFKEKNEYKLKHAFYSWAVSSQKSFFARSIKMIQLGVLLFGLKKDIPLNALPIDSELKKLSTDLKEADLVFFAGGGYLRSKKGITQSLNLLMQCYPFLVASLLKKKIIVGPISFGPFGYSWHEKIVTHVLKKVHLVTAREEISYKIMEANGLTNIILTSDFAFFLEKNVQSKKKTRNTVIGLTIRNWFHNSAQLQFENEIIESLKKLSKKLNLVVQPIIQVNAPMYGDMDAVVAQRVSGKLKKEKIKVAAIAHPTSVKDALRIYEKLHLLIGMRMHSNILASMSGTPFIGISYEHKTEGIAKQLGVEAYCIKGSELNQSLLSKTIKNAHKKNKFLRINIKNRINEIRKLEAKKWKHIFHEIA